MAEQYSLQIINHQDRQEVQLSGNLVIQHMDKITEKLRDALHFKKPVEIRIQHPEALDISLIQLLLAVHKSCIANNTELDLKASVKDDFVKLIENAGFNQLFN